MGRCVRTSHDYICSASKKCTGIELDEDDFEAGETEEVDEKYYDYDNGVTYSEAEDVPEYDEYERIIIHEGVCNRCKKPDVG